MFSDQKTYQNLILCLIPYDTASPKAVQEILIWILMKHELENEYNKTDCLLIWIASKYFHNSAESIHF